MAAARVLYNVSWINGGCDEAYPQAGILATTTDNLLWTYATNYAIGIVGMLAMVAVIRGQGSLSGFLTGNKHDFRLAAFFGLTGIGYLIAGVGHQFYYHPVGPEEPKHELAEKLSYAFIILGNASLSLILVALLLGPCPIPKCFEDICDKAALVVNAIVLGLTWNSSPPKDAPVGLICVLTNLMLMVLFTVRKMFGQAASMLFMILGFAVQFKLAPMCGDTSYKDRACWKDCPLPVVGYENPFNHNALYHTIYAAALALFAVFVCKQQAFQKLTDESSDHDSDSVDEDGERA
jgi:hypothetical protein